MIRVTRGQISKKRHKKILHLAKGFFSAHSRLFRTANTKVIKAFKYSFIGRKQKKRYFRKLWITRLNATIRKGTDKTYSLVMPILKDKLIKLNRKLLTELTYFDRKIILFIF